MLTAIQTLVVLNYAIKYYDQMEVMPIYQTNIMIWGILVGMFCLNEIQYYSFEQLAKITLATFICSLGAAILMKKTKNGRGYT